MIRHPLWRPLNTSANAQRQGERVAYRQTQPGPLQEHDPRWADDYESVRALVARALGEQALAIAHVGSTAIPDLWAKPIIDVDLTVAEVTDEAAWLPALEAAGFRLCFRDRIGDDEHRQLTLADPNANLHVWSPGAVEPRRHLLFVEWLREHADERRLYAQAKSAAAAGTGGARYNDLKAETVHAIYDRAFAADD